MENVDFHDFLDRMRNPAAADLVRLIKSFIMDFSSKPPDPENDSKNVQEFMTTMEGTFKVHPLWAGATDEELDSAGEGLEKYLMTKLFSRAFAPLPEDAVRDQKLFEKISLLQQFIRPEHLDIPPIFQNETSWLLAEKELQKINSYKAPGHKLVSILNCSRVILNISMAANENPPGADEFLPVLIYVVIKANPPQLRSNLLYIQRYRQQSRLVSEAAYFYTNLVSAESFIENLDSTSLSMDETEFERKMQAARRYLDGMMSHSHAAELVSQQLRPQSTENLDVHNLPSRPGVETTSAKASFANLQTNGTLAVLDASKSGQLARQFPFLYANVGDLRVEDVESLLIDYKELVLKYHALCAALDKLTDLKPDIEQNVRSGFTGDASEEVSSVQMASENEASKDLSHSYADEMDNEENLSKGEAENDSSGKSSSPQVVKGISMHDGSLDIEDKNVTFVIESSNSNFNSNILEGQVAETMGDDSGTEVKNVIEQSHRTDSGGDAL